MADELIKGWIYVQKGGFIKKWKRQFCIVYAKSSHGIERMQITPTDVDANSGSNLKIIKLTNCISIKEIQPTVGEFDSALQVVTAETDIRLATEVKDDLPIWIHAIASAAFPQASRKPIPTIDSPDDGYEDPWDMKDISVVIEDSQSSRQLNIRGHADISFNSSGIILKRSQAIVPLWLYKDITRVGTGQNYVFVEIQHDDLFEFKCNKIPKFLERLRKYMPLEKESSGADNTNLPGRLLYSYPTVYKSMLRLSNIPKLEPVRENVRISNSLSWPENNATKSTSPIAKTFTNPRNVSSEGAAVLLRKQSIPEEPENNDLYANERLPQQQILPPDLAEIRIRSATLNLNRNESMHSDRASLMSERSTASSIRDKIFSAFRIGSTSRRSPTATNTSPTGHDSPLERKDSKKWFFGKNKQDRNAVHPQQLLEEPMAYERPKIAALSATAQSKREPTPEQRSNVYERIYPNKPESGKQQRNVYYSPVEGPMETDFSVLGHDPETQPTVKRQPTMRPLIPPALDDDPQLEYTSVQPVRAPNVVMYRPRDIPKSAYGNQVSLASKSKGNDESTKQSIKVPIAAFNNDGEPVDENRRSATTNAGDMQQQQQQRKSERCTDV